MGHYHQQMSMVGPGVEEVLPAREVLVRKERGLGATALPAAVPGLSIDLIPTCTNNPSQVHLEDKKDSVS